jgi:hypothetical protein
LGNANRRTLLPQEDFVECQLKFGHFFEVRRPPRANVNKHGTNEATKPPFLCGKTGIAREIA